MCRLSVTRSGGGLARAAFVQHSGVSGEQGGGVSVLAQPQEREVEHGQVAFAVAGHVGGELFGV